MITETNLCMGCMSELDENGSCPNCGHYDTDRYNGPYLAPKTLLAERYVVGRIMSFCGESVLYIGYDLIAQRKVTIREYMPDTLCVREKDGETVTVRPDKLPLYKTYLAEFIELHRTLMKSTNIHCVQPVLNVFSENGTAYAVMDYIGGITLKAYLDNIGGSMTWEQVKELFPPLLTALSLLHEMGIIHRGISTSTIVISEKNELRLIGFSISAARTADSEIGYEVFSGYAPPEQYSSTRRNGSWTDVYGISAVLYRCLTGQTPVSATERLEDDTLAEPMLINRSIPRNVSYVINKGMSLEAEDRISTVTELVDRLFEQPKPAETYSKELSVPTERKTSAASSKGKSSSSSKGKNNSSSKKASSKKSRKKSKADKDKIKFIVGAAALGVIIIAFLLAIFIFSSNGDDPEPERTTASRTTAPAPAVTGTQSQTEIATEPPVSGNAEGYQLPDFQGSFFSTVSNSAQYSYLIFNATYDFSSEYEKGQIISQSIDGGTIVHAGTEINVVVSQGPENVPLPEYEGMKADEYTAELTKLGIKYRIENEESSEVEEGNVISCSKEPNESVNVAESEEVVVYVAIPPVTTTEETSTTVPVFPPFEGLLPPEEETDPLSQEDNTEPEENGIFGW